MKKTFYYTLDNELIKVYLIDGNVPREICRLYLKNRMHLSLEVRAYLIENDLYTDGSKIEML